MEITITLTGPEALAYLVARGPLPADPLPMPGKADPAPDGNFKPAFEGAPLPPPVADDRVVRTPIAAEPVRSPSVAQAASELDALLPSAPVASLAPVAPTVQPAAPVQQPDATAAAPLEQLSENDVIRAYGNKFGVLKAHQMIKDAGGRRVGDLNTAQKSGMVRIMRIELAAAK